MLFGFGQGGLVFLGWLGVAAGQLDQLLQVGGFVLAFGKSCLLLQHSLTNIIRFVKIDFTCGISKCRERQGEVVYDSDVYYLASKQTVNAPKQKTND
jgi:hypothetical protein